MFSQWTVTDAARHKGIAADLATLDNCIATQGKTVSSGPGSAVFLRVINGQTIYIKCYFASGRHLRKYLGRSRVRAEWENLQWFAQHGIPTPEIMAFGEEYHRGKYLRGVLVTAQLPDATDLEKMAKDSSSPLFDKKIFRDIAAQVASHVRVMHSNGFTHNDLDWRNILLAPAAENKTRLLVHFFDSPGGRRWVWPFLEYRITKDLSHLDKIARECLPSRWRLWFYRQYTGKKRLDASDKKRIRKILKYYDGR